MKKQTGPELGIIFGTIGCISTVLWLLGHPAAWPHYYLASMLVHLGHPLPAVGRALLGGAVAGVASLIPGAWLDGKVRASQRRAASRRADREAAELDADRAARQAKQATMDTATVARQMDSASRGHEPASLRFILSCVAAAATVLLTYTFFF